MTLPTDVERRLRTSLGGASSWSAVHRRIREEIEEGAEQQYRALIWAFAYDLISPGETERLAREGSVFGAIFEFPDGGMPPRLADVPDEDVATWGEAFEAIDDPRARSRLGDLLWSRRAQPNPHTRGRAACEALVILSHLGSWGALDRADGLVRALDLARELSDAALVAKVAARSLEVAREELAQMQTDRPGIVFSLLRALVDLRAELRPSDLLGFVRRVAERYADDPHHLETALELEAGMARAAEDRRALRYRQAELWRAAARGAEGILKTSFLERALDVARTHGLAELAKELRVELQSLTEDDLDLKTVSAEIDIDRELLDQFHAQFIRFKSWERSLASLGSYGPPTGDPEKTRETVEQEMRESPLRFLVNSVVLDPDLGTPIFRATDEQSHQEAAFAQHQWMATQLWAVSAVTVLEQFAERYRSPTRQSLTRFFTTQLIDEGMADRIATAFELWWEDRPDESAHVLVPRIEAAIRNLAREVGLPIIREPYAGKPGGVRPLGELLHNLHDSFPSEAWRCYLQHLLVDPLGANLRNVIAHGVRARVDRREAALLLHAIAFLRLIEVHPKP